MSLPPAAGSLDQRVTIQRRVVGVDAHGQESTTWQDVATVWASVRPVPGRDLLAAGQPQATFDATVRIRYRDDVRATDRLAWGTRTLELVGEPVDIDGQRHTLELRCLFGLRSGAAA